MTRGEILVADDDTAIRTVLNQALSRAGYTPRVTSNAATLWKWIASGEGQLVITDVVMPDENAFDLLPRIKRVRPELPVIVMSAQNTVLTAIKAAERGAYEYLPKPFDLNELIMIVGRAFEHARAGGAATAVEGEDEGLPLIGRSPAMQEIYRALARLTQNDLTVLITGESGTGKELVARALHDFSQRKGGPFVGINMGAIPKELIESELFGHEKGAFTGAMTRGIGRFEQAEGGTLFLDEIGDMPMDTQTRLLRVLQEGEYTTVGGRRPIRTDVRIVAATHRDLRHQIELGLFREDLYYRLNVVPLRLPALRERTSDVPDLATHFLKRCADKGIGQRVFEPDALEALKAYDWPGNVRELRNVVERLAALSPHERIAAEMVRAELKASGPPKGAGRSVRTREDLTRSVEEFLTAYFKGFGGALPPDGLYHRVIDLVEVPLIEAALQATRGNQIKAAELLGLNRNTLRKKIRDHNITVVKLPSQGGVPRGSV